MGKQKWWSGMHLYGNPEHVSARYWNDGMKESCKTWMESLETKAEEDSVRKELALEYLRKAKEHKDDKDELSDQLIRIGEEINEELGSIRSSYAEHLSSDFWSRKYSDEIQDCYFRVSGLYRRMKEIVKIPGPSYTPPKRPSKSSIEYEYGRHAPSRNYCDDALEAVGPTFD